MKQIKFIRVKTEDQTENRRTEKRKERQDETKTKLIICIGMIILIAAGLETPKLLEDASGLNMVLVDHGEYTQSADGLKDAHIITIVDHHGDGAVTTGNPLIYDARPIGSAATITWLRYRSYGVEPDRQSTIMMMGAILSDTKNLQSGTTTFADREAVKVLSGIGGITDVDAFYQGQ